MKIAQVWAEQSTCARMSVGCVVALDGRTLSSGFNGAPRGMPHCNHKCDCGVAQQPPESSAHFSHEPACASGPDSCVAVHAEANAIAFAARHGIGLLGSTLYTTMAPCVKCAQLIINAGVARVVWRTIYRDVSGLDLVVASGISTQQVL
jgi:dCMP deaminase